MKLINVKEQKLTMERFKQIIFLFFISAFSVSLTGCLDDEEQDFNNDVAASAQVIAQNSLFVDTLSIDEPGWVVIHADNGNNAPVVPDIISEPVQLTQAGNYNNRVIVNFTEDANLSDGTLVWVMLHSDTGTEGEYEFDGQSGEDPPIMSNNMTVMDSATIRAPMVEVSDQAVESNEITIDQARVGVRSWVVVHLADSQGQPGEVVGWTQLTQSNNSDVTVSLDDSKTYSSGDVLFAMLHIDAPPADQFGFPGGDDVPEVFGFDEAGEGIIVLDDFTVQ